MYQPQTHLDRIAAAQEAPNSRRKRRLLDKQVPFVSPEMATAKPDSNRTLRKVLQQTKAAKAAMKVDQAMKAAEKRGEVWEPNHKLRK